MARKSTKTAVNSVDAAMESKAEDIKTEDKAAEIKIAEEKAAEEKAPEKKTRTTKKTSAKTSAPKEEAAKTEEVKKETAKEPAKTKTTAKKAEVACALSVQYGGKEISQESMLATVKSIWQDDLNRKAGDLHSVELYVKPEENKVYYVVNKEVSGSFDI